MRSNPYIEFLIKESRWFDEYGEKVIHPMLAEMAKKIDEEWREAGGVTMGAMEDLLTTVYAGGGDAVAAVQRVGADWRLQLEKAADEIEKMRLTDEEREAITKAMLAYRYRQKANYGMENDGPQACGRIADTLCKLLERFA